MNRTWFMILPVLKPSSAKLQLHWPKRFIKSWVSPLFWCWSGVLHGSCPWWRLGDGKVMASCFIYSTMISQRTLDELLDFTGLMVRCCSWSLVAKCHVQPGPRFVWVCKNTCLAKLCPSELLYLCKIGWCVMNHHLILTWTQRWL